MTDGPSVPIPPDLETRIFAIQRPAGELLTYYSLCCVPLLLVPPVAILVWTVNYFRYHTLRYRFDREGISMRWGILFRREVILNYARIQDIHLVSNVIERWLGLARVQVQTASGSATPELIIEGLREFESIRDYLYLRMRGTHDSRRHPVPSPPELPSPTTVVGGHGELAGVLREIAGELRALRESLPPR